ncbi:ATP-binding cassette, subfamily B, AbcA/BmrA [Seinonella peptonophila]|uniref:ATP-binding cassette, subfamily B, AbcA/BmrA n=1 Tax=Seinonella peptonophila TaxID=112248 RepID=A0A1M4Y444_9BACL|nr:ABC transporter ATP-binding protein [Seinonella peptonophila]SHF00531.1 ATP-binding cassette, subfamily B, AbcA/BmrA [Seinonella peptonophila]
MKENKITKINLKQLLRLIQFSTLPKGPIILILILSLLQTTTGLIVPWFTKDLIDVLSVSSLNIMKICMLAGAFLIQAASGAFSTYYLAFLGEKVVANLRKRLWKHTLYLPISYFDQHRSGESISRINNDTTIVKELITKQLISIFTGMISLIGSLCLLFYLDWSMTLIMLIAVPIMFLVMRPIGNKIYQISKQLQAETAKFTSVLTQVVSEIRLVKAYTAENVEQRNGEASIENLRQSGLKEAKVFAILQPFMSLIMMLMLGLVIGYGGYRVATHALSAGALVAYIMYLFQILMPLTMMTQFFTSLQKAFGATERMIEMLEWETEPKVTHAPSIHSNQPIHIKQLSFTYQQIDEPNYILKDINVTIPPAKVTAIVGPSGGGKTTLFSLIERFYRPTSGEILLGEQSIQTFSLQNWRDQIRYVSQESPLLAGTIRENISYGMKREVTDEEIVSAAKLSFADAFISQLPKGYDSEVGERGIKLSGGQRQRIAIARALLHNPQILMLDEATSNLDSKAEEVVQKALQNLMKGRTTLIIAHRLSTVIDADQILVIEQGRLTGQGTHDQLLSSHRLYQQLVQQQFKWNRSHEHQS